MSKIIYNFGDTEQLIGEYVIFLYGVLKPVQNSAKFVVMLKEHNLHNYDVSMDETGVGATIHSFSNHIFLYKFQSEYT